MKHVGFFAIVLVALIGQFNLQAEPQLSVEFTAGTPGTTAWVAVNYATDTNAPSLQFDLLYSTNDLTSGNPVGGSALSDHQIFSSEVTPGLRRVLIFSLSNAAISNGVLAYVPFSIASNSTDHNEPLTLSNVVVSSVSGTAIPATSSNGVLAIALQPAFTAIFSTNGGAIHLQISGTSGRNYVVQSTTNLIQSSWIALYTNIAVGGILEFDDARPQSGLAQFYRAMVAP